MADDGGYYMYVHEHMPYIFCHSGPKTPQLSTSFIHNKSKLVSLQKICILNEQQ